MNNGASKEEIQEVLLQVSVYCGMPAGLESFRVAEKVFDDLASRRLIRPVLEPGTTIGFVGLGQHGRRRWRRTSSRPGYSVRGFDVATRRARTRGRTIVDAVTEVAEGADGVVLMLPNSKIVRAVLLDQGLLDALAPGTLLLDMS